MIQRDLSKFWIRKRRCILVFVIALCLLIILTSYTHVPALNHLFQEKESIGCFRMKANSSLPDISEITPRKGKSIFFHETSCRSFYNQKILVNARQACAVESAAKMNSGMDVYLLYSAPGGFHFEDTESDKMLQALRSYPNVRIMHLDYENYTKGTPVEKLYEQGIIENSNYAVAHASDILRYLTLWKYGGIYLDLDVVVIKSLEDLPMNYAGAESDSDVAAGVLSFTPDGRGHELAEDCLNDLKKTFNGQTWADSGPGVITRVTQSACGIKDVKEITTKDCVDFKVYPKISFYPVPWGEWKLYFNESLTESLFNLTTDSYAIHVWNKLSSTTPIAKTSKVPYLMFAKKYCPKVEQQTQEFF